MKKLSELVAGTEVLCGQAWYQKHRHDYTQADIEALTMTVSSANGSRVTILNRRESQGIVKQYVESKRKGD